MPWVPAAIWMSATAPSGSAAPSNASASSNCLWLDTSASPYKLKAWDGSAWTNCYESGAGSSPITRISAASGAAGADITWQRLAADATAITSVTPTVVMTTTGLSSGLYDFKYLVRYQSAATTTGIGIGVNYTGTSGAFLLDWWHVTTGGAAATGVGDQVAATVAGQLVEGKSERVKDTVSTASAGVDTINADMLAIVEGLVEVTGAGNLELKVRTEIAGSAITVKAQSLLVLEKIA